MHTLERSTNSLRLGEFLRTRRERLSPAQFGLPPLGRRRTPGLRREEVAQLTGISIAYYTWIEQGRRMNMSFEVLNAISRALQLSNAERTHLFTLAGMEVPEAVEASGPALHPTLANLLAASSTFCAIEYDAWFNVIAATRLATATFGLRVGSNVLRQCFDDPAQQRLWVDWKGEARILVGLFRQALAKRPEAPEGAALLEEMKGRPDFEPLWRAYDVMLHPSPDEYFRAEPWVLDHPVAGSLRFHRIAMAVPTRQERTLALYSAADAETSKGFERLISADFQNEQWLATA